LVHHVTGRVQKVNIAILSWEGGGRHVPEIFKEGGDPKQRTVKQMAG
jgi:hypothetical protein